MRLKDVIIYVTGFNSTLRQGNITHHEYIQVFYTFVFIPASPSHTMYIFSFLRLLESFLSCRLEKEGMLD